MPVDLTQLNPSTFATTALNPKFFSSVLTGNGLNGVGLLNNTVTPLKVTTTALLAAQTHGSLKYTKHKTGPSGAELRSGGFTPIHENLYTFSKVLMPLPDTKILFDAGVDAHMSSYHYYMELAADRFYHQKNLADTGSGAVDFAVLYRLSFYRVDANASDPDESMVVTDPAHLTSTNIPGNLHYTLFTWDVEDVLDNQAPTIIPNFDVQAALDWIVSDYSLVNNITDLANFWVDETDSGLTRVLPPIINSLLAHHNSFSAHHAIAEILTHLESMPMVPLTAYQNLYAVLATALKPQDLRALVRFNANLLMVQTLHQVSQIKDQVPALTVPAGVVAGARYSLQQKAAIETTEPFVLTQAAAGSGKSTMLMGRVDFLQACGVPLSDILVLSFTNAAADNITDKYPGINSMTIASMIDTIYRHNYPTQQLASHQTIANALAIFYPHADMAKELAYYLLESDKGSQEASTLLSSFVESNFDMVIQMLDRIKLTSLELEIIICSLKIDTMVEPNNLTARFVITDEVQDNSIYEFIYTLKYIKKHLSQLFIVGKSRCPR